MPATGQNIVHYAGNTRFINFFLTKADNTPLDLNGAQAVRWWMGKSNKATGTDVFVMKSNLTGSGEGGIALAVDTNGFWTATVRLDSDDTEDIAAPGNYYHELELIDLAGEVSTLALGKFKLVPVIVNPDYPLP